MEAVTFNKKYLLIGGGILITIILAFLFFRKGDQKERSGAVTDANTDPTSGDTYATAYNFTETLEGEREDGIIPISVGGDGRKTKTKLSSKAVFDKKVRAIIGQIIAEAPDGEWFQMIEQDMNEHWEAAAGMEIDEAIYTTARTYIAGNYYY